MYCSRARTELSSWALSAVVISPLDSRYDVVVAWCLTNHSEHRKVVHMTSTLEELAGQDTIDSRELLDRLDELEDSETIEGEVAHETLLSDDERDELKALRELQTETEGYAGDNWRDGVTFIADSFFEEYAQELADGIGAIDKDAHWPLTHIDWTAAADELRQDYTEVEIRGISYQYR